MVAPRTARGFSRGVPCLHAAGAAGEARFDPLAVDADAPARAGTNGVGAVGVGRRQRLGLERERPAGLAAVAEADGGGVPGQVGKVVRGELRLELAAERLRVVQGELEVELRARV